MRCENCFGWGWVVKTTHFFPRDRGVRADRVPCPDCGGSGVSHCCEGERPGNTPPAAPARTEE